MSTLPPYLARTPDDLRKERDENDPEFFIGLLGATVVSLLLWGAVAAIAYCVFA